MAILNPVLYGERLYSRETYSSNEDPQTFNLSLSDTVNDADAFDNTFTKVLPTTVFNYNGTLWGLSLYSRPLYAGSYNPDAIAFADSLITDVTKALSDVVSSNDSKLITASKVLSDSISSIDPMIIHSIIKTLDEAILLQDWLSIRLIKAQIWTPAPAVIAPYSTLYGQSLYAADLYSGLYGTVWISLKPIIPGNGWTNFNEMRNA